RVTPNSILPRRLTRAHSPFNFPIFIYLFVSFKLSRRCFNNRYWSSFLPCVDGSVIHGLATHCRQIIVTGISGGNQHPESFFFIRRQVKISKDPVVAYILIAMRTCLEQSFSLFQSQVI